MAASPLRPPFRLLTLGRLALVDADGHEEPTLAKRPRKLAVLAWIALAGRRTSRERLIGVFWGERTEERARNSLSDALSHLRRVLGHAALPAYQDQIGLAEDSRLSVDVMELKEAARAGDHERVVALYGGPFLDGVFVGEAPEFAHWSDEVRAGIDALFVRACQVHCAELANAANWLACEALARRWLRVDPASGEAALHLLNSLAAAGTRSARIAAVREFAALTTRLRREYDIAPEPVAAERARQLADGIDVQEPEASDVVPAATSSIAQPVARKQRLSVHRPATALAAVLVLFVLVTLAATRRSWRIDDATATHDRAQRSVVPAVHPHSVAVLRFRNISNEVADQYFSDGMAEEIIQALARLDGVQVAGRSASFPISSDSLDPREMTSRLSVASLLEGSVRRAGDSLRIAVRLINADGYTLWQETYDRSVAHAFAVQEEVAKGVAAALLVNGFDDSPRPPRAQTDFDTYDLYLRGRYAWWNAQSEAAIRQSIGYFRRALARDSTFAPAWVGLADAFLRLTSFHDVAPAEVVPSARAALLRARALDPALADVHASLGYLATFHERRWSEAEADFRRALQLDVRHANARLWYAWLLSARGRHEEAVQRLREAQTHQPYSPMLNVRLATMLYFARDFEGAIQQSRAAIQADSTFWLAHRQLGEALLASGRANGAIAPMQRAAMLAPSSESRARLAYALARTGQADAARGLLAQLTAADSVAYVNPIELARVHVGLGETDEALRLLERGVELGASIAIILNVEPMFDPLRKEPRFQALIKRLGF